MTRVHISLQVTDLEASVQFYNAVFEKQPDKRRDDYANYRVDQPGLMLSLVAAGDPNDNVKLSEHRHYGIELESAEHLETWRGRISSTDLSMRREDDVICCYAKADKFWLSDPDGNAWEFWVRKDDAESMYEPPPAQSSRVPKQKKTNCCG